MTDQSKTPSDDDVAKTLAEYERIAQGTGEWDGREPTEFSNDGVTWSPLWVPTTGHAHPQFARSTVHRKGVLIPTTEYAVWDEACPTEDAYWMKAWADRPRVLFGAWVARRALRTAFRAALADKREPDDGPRTGDETAAPAARDWDAEIASADTVDALDRVWADAKAPRARTGAREKAYNDKRASIARSVVTVLAEERVLTHEDLANLAPTGKATPVPSPPKVKLGKPQRRQRVPAKHRPKNPAMTAALAAAVTDADAHGRPVARAARRAARAQGQP